VTQELSRRLTITDASFLYVEKPNQPMHVGSLLLYEGDLSRDELIKILRDRMHLLPRYRQKVVFPPFGVDHPTWEDDPDFDVANHVTETTLPAPGDDRTLSEVGGALYAPVLDRNRPLWQAHVLHGRPDGNTAVIWKIHHCMVDGVSMIDMMLALHDVQRDAPPPAPAPPWQPRPIPDPLTLLQDAVRDRMTEAAERWTDSTFRWLRSLNPAERQRAQPAALGEPVQFRPPPQVPINGTLSTRRQFGWAEFSFTEIRAIRSALGGTINDVVLSVVAGALGRYLRAHGVGTEGMVLWAICPVSLRRPEERGALGNRVSVMVVPLYVGIDDPAARLTEERKAVDRLKAEDQAGTFAELTEMGNVIPPAWQALAAQTEPSPNVTLINTASSNVPGPQIPLYLAGRQLLSWRGLAPLGGTMGMFNGIVSYNGTLAISATVDPVLVPDVWCNRE